DALTVLTHEIQAVFVDEHLGVLEPHGPRLLRDVVEHFFSEVPFEGWLFQTGKLSAEFDAMDGSRHDSSFVMQCQRRERKPPCRRGPLFWDLPKNLWARDWPVLRHGAGTTLPSGDN